MKWLKDRFVYAFSGLKYCLQDKSIFLQFLLGLCAIVAGILFHCSSNEWLWILLCICLVISFEIINSCIEHLVDYISLDRNPKAKQIKDMAASAVFLVSLFALVVACIIFIPKVGNIYGI